MKAVSTTSLVRTTHVAGVAAWMLAAESAHAQQLGAGRSIEIPLIQMGAGLVLCALVAFVAALVIRRFAGGKPAGIKLPTFGLVARHAGDRIRVLESHRLSPHADICRFVAANREYLVIVSAGAAVVLRDCAWSENAADPEAGT